MAAKCDSIIFTKSKRIRAVSLNIIYDYKRIKDQI